MKSSSEPYVLPPEIAAQLSERQDKPPPPIGKFDLYDYRQSFRKCLEAIGYHDKLVGKNKGDKEPIQEALKFYIPIFERYIGFQVINLTVIDKREIVKPNPMERPSWGSYTIMYPRKKFNTQGRAILAAMSSYDRKEYGVKVYMDGHLDKLLAQFGREEFGTEYWSNFVFEIRDSLCVVQPPTNDVSDDTKTGRVLGENHTAWICTMLLLSNFFAQDYSNGFHAIEKVIHDFKYIRFNGLTPTICYKERLTPAQFPPDQPPPPGAPKSAYEGRVAHLPEIPLAPPPAKQPSPSQPPPPSQTQQPSIYLGPFVSPPDNYR